MADASDLTGTITFYEFFEPPMESGTYKVTVEQTVGGGGSGSGGFTDSFSSTIRFGVQGVRFQLPPGYLLTQYPPPGMQGEFSNVLPHTVLASKTLPWQRDVGIDTTPDKPYPWLALLTFDTLDPPPPVTAGTLADLMRDRLPDGVFSYPDLQPDYGESAGDPVQYIDVPGDLFAAIAPSAEDMRWLCSARELSDDAVTHASLTARTAPAQDFSSVVSNRLPSPGHKTVCCLVSLEDMARYLPGNATEVVGDVTAIRLAVLATWSFGCIEQKETFADYLEALDRSPGTLQVPYTPPGEPNRQVADALSMGYAAFNHHTRQGANTVSWYRGPLLPYHTPTAVGPSVASADALVRYDPDTGMFDGSLAAAWQLGQLLALNDKTFATLLYNWKRKTDRKAVVDFEKAFLSRELGLDPTDFDPAEPFHGQLLKAAVVPMLKTLLRKGERA